MFLICSSPFKSVGRGSNPGRGDIFRACPDRPWGPPSLLYNGYRVFPGSKERPGRDPDPSPLLVLLSRKSRAIHLLPLWAVRSVQSLSACRRAHFTFHLRMELASYHPSSAQNTEVVFRFFETFLHFNVT